eukprot:scaffold7513_cov296-Pinguiococcus_pyrenoidosus.AAC.4
MGGQRRSFRHAQRSDIGDGDESFNFNSEVEFESEEEYSTPVWSRGAVAALVLYRLKPKYHHRQRDCPCTTIGSSGKAKEIKLICTLYKMASLGLPRAVQ